MNFHWKQWVFALSWGLILIVLLNTGTGLWALKRLEKKAGTPIAGSFRPHFFKPAFTLKDAKLSWQDRFEVLSGTVKVQYDPLSVVAGRRFRIQVEGSNMKVHFLKGPAFAMAHPTDVKIDYVAADFALTDKKNPEIFALNINSPEIEFHFSEKDKNEVKTGGLLTEN